MEISKLDILSEEFKAFQRFYECVSDDEEYDVSLEMMDRLSKIGLVRHIRGRIFEHTHFGLALLRSASGVNENTPHNQKKSGNPPVIWTDKALLSLMNSVGDGPYGEKDYEETRKFMQASETLRAELLGENSDSLEKELAIRIKSKQPFLTDLSKRQILDAIRSAYDSGYEDARNARSIPGDGAPGYQGRDVEKTQGQKLINSLEMEFQRNLSNDMSNDTPAELRNPDYWLCPEVQGGECMSHELRNQHIERNSGTHKTYTIPLWKSLHGTSEELLIINQLTESLHELHAAYNSLPLQKFELDWENAISKAQTTLSAAKVLLEKNGTIPQCTSSEENKIKSECEALSDDIAMDGYAKNLKPITLESKAAQPNCGACPGDGSVCPIKCRLKAESPESSLQNDAVAWFVIRNSPGKRDHGMKLGPFWIKEEAEQLVDENHTLYELYSTLASESPKHAS